MRGMTIDELYIICVDYYHGDEKGNEWTEPAILGVEGPHKLLIFDEKPCGRTKIFRGEREALAYIKDFNLNDSFCYTNARICPLSDAF